MATKLDALMAEMQRPIVACSVCGSLITLPAVAVSLRGILRCGNGHIFAYPASIYYRNDGTLRP